MIPVPQVNNQSMLLKQLDTMKRKDREKPKASSHRWNNKTLANSLLGGDVQVRVKARSLILGLIGKKFSTDNSQIFKKRVMRTQNQDSLRLSILTHLENWASY
jgi:hypothetical protein